MIVGLSASASLLHLLAFDHLNPDIMPDRDAFRRRYTTISERCSDVLGVKNDRERTALMVAASHKNFEFSDEMLRVGAGIVSNY